MTLQEAQFIVKLSEMHPSVHLEGGGLPLGSGDLISEAKAICEKQDIPDAYAEAMRQRIEKDLA